MGSDESEHNLSFQSDENAVDPHVERMFLHVACVYFHHRNGPQIEYIYPQLPSSPILNEGSSGDEKPQIDSSRLPEEWKFLPFMCLPDGAHAFDKHIFVCFHLPPVPSWKGAYSRSTLFGLSCCRSISTDVDLPPPPHTCPPCTRSLAMY